MNAILVKYEAIKELRTVRFLEKIATAAIVFFFILLISVPGNSDYAYEFNVVDTWTLKDYIIRMLIYLAGLASSIGLYKSLRHREHQLRHYLKHYFK